MNLPQLYFYHQKKTQVLPRETNEKGSCTLCGKRKQVESFNLPRTFTDHDLLNPTGKICFSCKLFFSDRQKLRYANWLLTKEMWCKLQRWDVLSVFLTIPKNTMFACYTTNTYKRYGFLQTLNIINHSPINFYFAHDHYMIHFQKSKVEEYGKFIRSIQKIGISRNLLRRGNIAFCKELSPEELYKINKRLKNYSQNPLWEWVLDFIPPLKHNINIPNIDTGKMIKNE